MVSKNTHDRITIGGAIRMYESMLRRKRISVDGAAYKRLTQLYKLRANGYMLFEQVDKNSNGQIY
jgi:hypothetical protein